MSSVTKYPFAIPAALVPCLPAGARDGNRYCDVCVAGTWEGILVVNDEGLCIGVYALRTVVELPLPFTADQIQAVRAASWWNRLLAAIPCDLYSAAVATVVAFSPAALLLGATVWPGFMLLVVLVNSVAIYVMYRCPGWPLSRLSVALAGMVQLVYGCCELFRWFRQAG